MNNKIFSIDENGNNKEYSVILTFKNDDNEKNYVVYTDNTKDNENKLRIYASIYDPESLEFISVPDTKKEWDEIYRVVDNLLLF